MKLSLTFVTVLLALCKAEKADPESRILRRQSGGGKPSGDRLKNMCDTEWPNFECDDTESIDCTFEKPERPDTTGLDEDAIAQLKTEVRAKKEEFRQKMLKCACCAMMSVEDILAVKEEGGSRPFGGSESGRPSMGESGGGDGSSRPVDESGRPGMGSGGMSRGGSDGRPGMGGGDGSGRPGMDVTGEGSPPQGGGDGSSGRPGDGMSIQEMLVDKCPDFKQECAGMAEDNIDCSRFDSMNTNTRGRRRKSLLYCGCCRD